jgi:hypothetical protein
VVWRKCAKYLVAFRGWDDDFDTDFGYTGKLQFLLGLEIHNRTSQPLMDLNLTMMDLAHLIHQLQAQPGGMLL